MKKFLTVFLLTAFITLKSTNVSAQTFEQGFIAGYEFATEKLKMAADAHPEWGLIMVQISRDYFGGSIITFKDANDDYQKCMLAASSVNTDYGGYVLSMKDVNDGWNGYYWGFQQACADFVIGT